jgi:hypothetical protein
MNKLLMQGITDAMGFVGGGLAGMFVARAFGMDIFAQGYGGASIGGILLCGLGGGAGLQLARYVRAKVYPDKKGDE